MIKSILKSQALIGCLMMFLLILLVQIPINILSGMVMERTWTQKGAIKEVSNSNGGKQTVNGPVLTIPYNKKLIRNKGDGTENEVIRYNFHIYPDSIKINGEIFPENRNRGIFKISVYTSKISTSGDFKIENIKALNDIPVEDILWNEAFVSVGITSTKAIKDEAKLNFNGSIIPFEPGLLSKTIFETGIHAPVGELISLQTKNVHFSFDLSLGGAESFSLVPVAKISEVNIKSPWKDPSFFGDFLPDTRVFSDDGFNATWKLTDLGSTSSRTLDDRKYDYNKKQSLSLGINFISQVDSYSIVQRSLKYELLFISITFLSFFLLEILGKLRIHPIQYLFIGAGMVLFYLLFLALSEHLKILYAYTIAGSSVICIISGYSMSVLKSKSRTFMVAASIALQYSFLYAVLNAEDYALLIGSIGLTFTLIISMYLTRNINWYNLNLSSDAE